MPWSVSYDKLDSDQRDFVDQDTKGICWLKGFAGTGKSVLLVNKLQAVFEEDPEARCCVISYAKSLLEAFNLGFEETSLKSRVSPRMFVCSGAKGKIDLVTKYEFKRATCDYDFVFVDEVQDLCPSDLRLLSKIPNVIVAGDENQSIYTKDVKTKEVTLKAGEISSILDPKEVFELSTLHRLTPSILSCVKTIMPVLNERLEGTHIEHTRNRDVPVYSFSKRSEESKFVYKQALDYAEDIKMTAILFPMHWWIIDFIKDVCDSEKVSLPPGGMDSFITKKKDKYTVIDYTGINKFFWGNGIKLEYVGNGHGSFKHAVKNNNIILMTYHSSKGMDFENVFIPFLSVSKFSGFGRFMPGALMVAMTRSNYNLTLSYTSEGLSVVKTLENAGVVQKIDQDEEQDVDSIDSFVLDF